jgi:hypothetical protein
MITSPSSNNEQSNKVEEADGEDRESILKTVSIRECEKRKLKIMRNTHLYLTLKGNF